MSPTVTSIDEIDLDIAVAYIALGAARSGLRRGARRVRTSGSSTTPRTP